ncbi:hypothetical protein ACJX0J_020968, partial [Zea mays]
FPTHESMIALMLKLAWMQFKKKLHLHIAAHGAALSTSLLAGRLGEENREILHENRFIFKNIKIEKIAFQKIPKMADINIRQRKEMEIRVI